MRSLLDDAFRQALQASAPERLTRAALPDRPPARILAVGKAAVPMARAASEAYPQVPVHVTPPSYDPEAEPAPGDLPAHWTMKPGSHPLPDRRSVAAARSALAFAAATPTDGTLLVLISGGGSALWCAPDGIDLEAKRSVTAALLRAGATIHELNLVRTRLSQIKGGGLAAAVRGRVLALALSDVPGNEVGRIASGPTVGPPPSWDQALAVLDRYRIEAPTVRTRLEEGRRASAAPHDAPQDASQAHGDRTETRVIGSNRTFLEALAAALERSDVRTSILGDRFVGEARDLAKAHAAIVRSVQDHGTPVAPPVALLSGGEATVTVRGDGVGGRNLEFALAFALELGAAAPWTLSAGTDGQDGSSPAAGAFVTPDTFARARAAGLDLRDHLERNDAGTLFERLGDAYVTGPTRHNLNDVRAILVQAGTEREA